ncbi:VanW family protein, partial [Cellulomonas massiliensis]|uniref:VanW family protein n=1 Tax=Cellulomonas massiliensis TaxID=1465811 RepID=UPI0003623B70
PVPPTPRNPSPLDDFESDDRPSRAPRVLAVLGVVVLLLVGGYVAASFAFGDKVPRGATVAGVPIGGLARDDAVARLEEDLEDASTGPVEVVAHDVQAAIDPAKAGLRFDAEATVDGLVGTDLLEPARLWRQVAGVGAVTPSTSVDEDALAAAIEELGGSLSAEPVDAGIVFVDQSASTTKAEDGWTVDADAAARALSDQWLTAARPVELPTTTVEPAITQAEADEAYDRVAKHVGSAPVSVEVEDRVAVLDPATVVANAAMVPVDGALQLQMNGEKLADEVVDQLPDLLTAAEDAHFTFEDGKPTLVEGEAGTKIDPAALATAVARAASGSDRTATVELVPTDPEDTTKAMEELGITEVVSEFKTPLTSEQRRTTNIRQGLKNLTGVLVRPGEDFSLTESLGPIDAQHGFVQAGVIVNGEHQDGIGGGLSQVSTTTFNAAFFAGFEILEHQPHSEWFQRYPEGREATMYLGSIDMRFKNDSPYGALIRGWVSGGYAHVQIWSTKHFDVATTTGPRSNVVSPRTVYSQSPTCVPQAAGNPGFRVTVNRTVTAPDGEVKEKNSWTTTYRPQNRVVCGKAPSAEKDEEKESD